MTGETVAAVLKARRKSNNLKIDEVAAALKSRGIEVSQKTIYGYEIGHRHPDAETFLALCAIYEINDLTAFSGDTETSAVPYGGLSLTAEEAGLIELFRLMPEDKRGMFRSMLEAALKSAGQI
jgi:transcriptional regulator with XRE-family HTH domain